MRKKALLFSALALLFAGTVIADDIVTKDGKDAVVNTTTLTKNVKGFRGPTPVRIHIKGNKIVKVEALPNQEGPKYLNAAKKVLTKYEGVSVNKAEKMKVDGVTGATFTSKALIKNVQAGVKYYKQHK